MHCAKQIEPQRRNTPVPYAIPRRVRVASAFGKCQHLDGSVVVGREPRTGQAFVRIVF